MKQTTLYQTRMVEPQKLLDAVMFARVDYSLLAGAEVDSEMTTLLEQALPLIKEAWELPQESLIEAQQIIQREHQAVLHQAKTGEVLPCSLPPEKILESMGGNQILDIMWSLFETAVRTPDADKREWLLKTAQCLSEYWNLDEWIAD